MGDSELIHMASNLKISENNMCEGCVFKLYAKPEDVVTFGIGNTNGDFIFVLPSYDFKAKAGYHTLLTYLQECYKDITGVSLFEDVYVTRLVKCSYQSEHSLYNNAIKTCHKYLNSEFKRLDIKRVVFFGTAYDDYITAAPYNYTISNIKNISTHISPGVIYYGGDDARKDFTNSLRAIIKLDYY